MPLPPPKPPTTLLWRFCIDQDRPMHNKHVNSAQITVVFANATIKTGKKHTKVQKIEAVQEECSDSSHTGCKVWVYVSILFVAPEEKKQTDVKVHRFHRNSFFC